MSDENSKARALLPSHSSYTLHGLCIALADVIHEEISGDVSRRSLLKASGLATATEFFAHEVAHFFGSRMGEDHDALEALQERYVEEVAEASNARRMFHGCSRAQFSEQPMPPDRR